MTKTHHKDNHKILSSVDSKFKLLSLVDSNDCKVLSLDNIIKCDPTPANETLCGKINFEL